MPVAAAENTGVSGDMFVLEGEGVGLSVYNSEFVCLDAVVDILVVERERMREKRFLPGAASVAMLGYGCYW
jgi:hypothetical protein